MRIRHTGLVFDDPKRSTPGYVLIRPVEGDTSFLLRPDGSVAHKWITCTGMTNWSYLLPNGNLFANERSDIRKGVALTVSGRMSEYGPDGTLIWRHEDPYQHHDARRLGDGVVYAAFTELSDSEKARVKGGIPGSETPGGPFGEAIRRVDETGALLWEWHFTNLLERYELYRNANRWSYGHTNTVLPLGNDTYLVSSKNLNLLVILDATKGEVVWAFQDDALGGQHDAQMLENGNVLIFANGLYGADLSHSQIWEIDPETNEIIWRYSAWDDFTSFYSPHMGGVQRLPSGNTLICEGNKGCLFEVTPEGEVVREFVSPHFVESQFGQINWLFRARWYAPDAPEILALAKSIIL
ncbi:MAG: arylsulfotransferase family protein [Pseudomonadota bacterium]